MIFFSDRGAWHGYVASPQGFVDAKCPGRDDPVPLVSSIPVESSRVESGRWQFRLTSGEDVVLTFRSARVAVFSGPKSWHLETGVGPFQLRRVTGGYEHEYLRGPLGPGRDLSALPDTLRRNYCEPRGDWQHGGVIPSPFAYPGFWAWDSWKHAAVLPTGLAREQIQAMLDEQLANGMVPDTVMPDRRDNNVGCSKPPLLAWACSRHPGLLHEFDEPLRRYHDWWQRERRPDGSPWLAYGGVSETHAKWESGWDNATRFDDVKLVNGLQNLLAVDLNAFALYEKSLLGCLEPEMVEDFQKMFFHNGAFFDVTWPDGKPLNTLTAATWIPVWCGLANQEQTESVIRLLMDEAHFNTPLPFPTVARSDPKFDPDGYWRGAVWFDHAVWAVQVLLRAGYHQEARDAANRLRQAAPDYECYNPLTGKPCQGDRPAVPQFSWTAAANLELDRCLPRLEGGANGPGTAS